MGKVRVVIVTAFPRDPQTPHGGVEAVSIVLVRALAACSDLDLQVVTLDPGAKASSAETWEGVTIHRLPLRGRFVLASVLAQDWKPLSQFVESLEPDVVHAHDVFGAMLRGLKARTVFTVHGFIHADTAVSGGRLPRLRSRIWKSVEERTWRRQDHIISISPYVRERIAAISGPVVHDIDNPVRREFFDVRREPDADVIFTASVVNRRKNVLKLVQAVALLHASGQRPTLRIAGAITDAGYGEIVRRFVADRGLERFVHFLGPVPVAAVEDELRRATVFALTSLEENSPMGIEEAMAAATPVVTSNRCGMPYMVRDGDSGFLVDPEEPADIADALRTLLSSRALQERMALSGRAIATDRFHPDIVARRTRDVYLQALHGRDVYASPSCKSFPAVL